MSGGTRKAQGFILRAADTKWGRLRFARLNLQAAAAGGWGTAEAGWLTPRFGGEKKKSTSAMTREEKKKEKKPVARFPEVPNAATGKALEIKEIKKRGKEGENAFMSSQANSMQLSYYFSFLAFETEQRPGAFSADGQCACLNHLTAVSLISRTGAKLNNK